MMDHAAGVRWFQLVCSTAIANICLSVKWIVSKKGFFFLIHFVRSGSLSAKHIRAAIYIVAIYKLLTSSTFHLQVCNEKHFRSGFSSS